ncbi:DUF429 domain-containing protein [Sphingopyxis sp.]|uniref:DUF429 domain-containing protein n=1 Tax=Sphingopyxis sp. TaxID=1908224 RepID=UPI0025F145F4|nr:DUF429 domain-containing protein [Sphingopyxis sp.]
MPLEAPAAEYSRNLGKVCTANDENGLPFRAKNMTRRPRAVLGIDAAWTLTQPSGVALAVEMNAGWRMVAAEPSYDHFLAQADHSISLDTRPSGSAPDAAQLVRAAEDFTGARVVLVAIDMPLSRTAIVSRRTADNEVSRAYGARKCSTHTPSTTRPGAISDNLREGFEAAGFPLRTTVIEEPGLIEVYPHPALVELTEASERLPYKLAKTRTYWKNLNPIDRKKQLIAMWAKIANALDEPVPGSAHQLARVHPSSAGFELKATEDCLDAMVCAWVAIEALRGQCKPFGDEEAAIWIPLRN